MNPGEKQAVLRAIEDIRERAQDAVSHVGQANYQDRCDAAERWVDEACRKAVKLVEAL